MSRPTLEVADILRAFGSRFVERSRARISWPQHKVMRAIERCRTAALGAHRDRCTQCGHDFGYSYNSCRNRHCPKCQTQARNQWIAARTRDLVPLSYFHIVFTVPHQLSELMLQNKRVLYDLLFQSVAATLKEVAANPNTWERKLASSACCIPGDRLWCTTRISIASCRPGDSLPAATLGFGLATLASSYPCWCSAKSFAESSSMD